MSENYSPSYQDISDPWKKSSWAYLDLIGQDREWTPTRIPRTVTANTSINRLDDLLYVDCTAGDITITMETAVGADGRPHTIMKSDSSANSVIIDGNGSETINGAATYEIAPRQNAGVHLKAQGGNWLLTGVAAANWAPAGADTQVQYNDGGFFGASANFTFTKGTNTTAAHTLTVTTGNLTVTPGNITTGNTNNLNLNSSGGTILRAVHVASSVNFLQVIPSITGSPIILRAGGTDASTDLYFQGKAGAGSTLYTFYKTAATTIPLLQIGSAGSDGPGYVKIEGGATAGVDALNYYALGSGTVTMNFIRNAGGAFQVCRDDTSTVCFNVSGGAPGGRYLNVTVPGTNSDVVLNGAGTNPCSITFAATGNTSAYRFVNLASGSQVLRIESGVSVAPLEDGLKITGGGPNVGHNVTIAAIGDFAAAVDLNVNAKGTGSIIIGNILKPSANDGAGLGVSGTAWSDLFLASGAIIDWAAGDVTLTHAANTLTFAGASSGYNFDADVIDSVTSGFYWYAARGAARVSLRA